jgi:aminoglycoside phosphotransferase (APT) family kinase protein
VNARETVARNSSSDSGDAARDDIAGRLEELLGEPLAGRVTQLSSGASRRTFALATASGRELVAQLERGQKLSGATPAQAPLLEAAARAGVPVPQVVAHGRDDPVLGPAWTVVEALSGTTDPKRILAGEDVPGGAELIEQIAAALAAVHSVPADSALAPEVADPLALLREMHDSLGEPHPTFELAFRRLETARPAAGPRALVHGDFRMGNLMVAPQGLTGVLDWELAHLGDPAEDLGWLCVPAWRFTRPQLPAAGLGTREQLLAAYERHAGRRVDAATLAWWELAGTLRWGVICVMQAFVHLSGSAHSIEHAVIGRRACEVEWDLLNLLEADGERTAAPSPPRGDAPTPRADSLAAAQAAIHDRPTALELLAAARSTLGDDVLPVVDGRAAFQLRVTMRALGIVARELEGAERHTTLHDDVLRSLGVRDEGALAAAVRDGALDGREAELLGALRETVRAKLEVANPGYLRSEAGQQR